MPITTRELIPGDVVSLTAQDPRPQNVYEQLYRRQQQQQQQQQQHHHRTVPADILLLSGTAVTDEALLTGESVPQLKHAIEVPPALQLSQQQQQEERLDVQDPEHKESVLFAGTTLLVSTPEEEQEQEQQDAEQQKQEKAAAAAATAAANTLPPPPPPPDGGVVGFVLRTGFETTQGNLLRTMAHSSRDVDGIHTADTFVFVLILIACAVAAAAAVLESGWHDPRRNRFRLALHVVMIVTSVVPPELPMELSLAVTNSVADLVRRCQVYCTELYRIPLAGQVTVCCFDKTGTLTSDEMRLLGVRVFNDNHEDENNINSDNEDAMLISAATSSRGEQEEEDGDENNGLNKQPSLPWPVLRVMVSCHSLALSAGSAAGSRDGAAATGEGSSSFSPGDMVGDPLEQAVLLSTPYRMTGPNTVSAAAAAASATTSSSSSLAAAMYPQMTLLHRFAFNSKLKRMTVLAVERPANNSNSVQRSSSKSLLVRNRGLAGMGTASVSTTTTTTGGGLWALCKGAPETLKDLMDPSSVPAPYDTVARYHMGRGRRVLAMAYRQVSSKYTGSKQLETLRDAGRSSLERNLHFAGFLILDCPLKPDTRTVITELKKSGHDAVMITGDAVLTAAEVARQVGIIQSSSFSSFSSSSSKRGKKQQQEQRSEQERRHHVTYKIQAKTSKSANAAAAAAETDDDDDDVLSRFECVPLTVEHEPSDRRDAAAAAAAATTTTTTTTPKDTEASLPLSPARALQDLLERKRSGMASFCISGNVLTQIATAAVASSSSASAVAVAVAAAAKQPPPVLGKKPDAPQGSSAAAAAAATQTKTTTTTTTKIAATTDEEKHTLLNGRAQAVLQRLVPIASVFARHAPHQKEAVVAALNRTSGCTTLMCGDGTNDVAALKRAHVGISIVSAPAVESKRRNAVENLRQASSASSSGKGEEKRDGEATSSDDKSGGGGKKKIKTTTKKKKKKLGKGSTTGHGGGGTAWEEYVRQLREAQEELDEVELGDASVAAPFTSRAVSIQCCKDVIQQGRCTLVTMVTIYKILGINCLVNAAVLSVLFLHGVKQGDRQLTALGLAVAALFYLVTRAEPMPYLSSLRPQSSVLSGQVFGSIFAQTAVHLAALAVAAAAALRLVDARYDPSLSVPDGPFNPNVLNSSTFLMTCCATMNTFAANYRGRPFMGNLRENKILYRTLLLCYAVLAVTALEVFPPLSDLLQLTALSSPPSAVAMYDEEEDRGDNADQSSLSFLLLVNRTLAAVLRTVDFGHFMTGLMVIDTVLVFGIERWIVRVFEGKAEDGQEGQQRRQRQRQRPRPTSKKTMATAAKSKRKAEKSL